jgi:dTDP-4-dehydrorhamnose reductase
MLVRICIGDHPAHRDAHGFLHLRNAGETNWFDFAREILEQAGYDDICVEPVATSAFETKAPRPAYSVLDRTRASEMGLEQRPWDEALADYLSGGDSCSRSASRSGSASEPGPGGSQSRQRDEHRSRPANEVQR